MKVAFLGLGVMGFEMAGHLAKAGHQVTVYNRTPSKSQLWLTHHPGILALTPAQAAIDQDMVFSCVGNDQDLEEICLAEHGAFNNLQPHCLFVDHTTTSARLAKHLYSILQKKHCGFIDAPVSGGQVGAQKGQLTVMCGGNQADVNQATPIISAYAKAVAWMGPSGNGQLSKMVNQICIASLLQGLAEGLRFGQNAGLDCEKLVQVMSQGAAQSWQMNQRAHTMLNNQFDFGFAVDWMRKDLNLALSEAKQNRSELPITALIDQFYATLQANGQGRCDTSSLITRLNRLKPTA